MKNKIEIINTGGTFNKIYNPLKGKLEVPKNNFAVDDILTNLYKTNDKPDVCGIIYKDSLDINSNDRKKLLHKIKGIKSKKIIIIHGTDTMGKSATYLAKHIKNKKIVFVGAMQPYSYEKVEASANLALAIGFLSSKVNNGIYISMNGLVSTFDKIVKNYKLGKFECL